MMPAPVSSMLRSVTSVVVVNPARLFAVAFAGPFAGAPPATKRARPPTPSMITLWLMTTPVSV
ncbi:MAG: hypothetical protein ACRYGM_05850 [Janthinobacterium lividum]